MPNYIIAPISNKQNIGKLNIHLNGQLVTSKNLIALKAVTSGGWWTRTTDSMGLWFKSFGDDDD